MVAVTTSFMAPLLLRLTMKMVRITDDEAARIAADAARGLFDGEKLRVLVPTAGGPNALVAAKIGMCIGHRSAHKVSVLFVERATGLLDRFRKSFRRTLEGKNLEAHLDAIKEAATAMGLLRRPRCCARPAAMWRCTIRAEAAKGYDLILTGAAARIRRSAGRSWRASSRARRATWAS